MSFYIWDTFGIYLQTLPQNNSYFTFCSTKYGYLVAAEGLYSSFWLPVMWLWRMRQPTGTGKQKQETGPLKT